MQSLFFPYATSRNRTNLFLSYFFQKKKEKLRFGIQILFPLAVILVTHLRIVNGNPDAKRLYDDLISRYNKLVRPVHNVSDPLTVHIKLKLSQLIEVNLKNQIMTTNLWVEQYWSDNKLSWDPKEYGGVDMLHVPSDQIWRPDIVLYNNADGNFEVTLATKAILNSKGMIQWKPPAIYKSSCGIDVRYFPFDEQTCIMKFGSWTYDGFKVDLRHRDEVPGTNLIEMGIDLTEFYLSVEWDILEVPAIRNEKFYTCCVEPYIDITFNISMRRKTLFYTVNIVIPCMGISFLTVLVFYLPSDSGEKVALSVSILLSLTVFFLLLAEIIPPTSLVVPLLGKYLLFTMILVTLSILVTVIVLNVHFRSSSTHRMAPWVNKVFVQLLPRLLMMSRPPYVNTVAEINPRIRDTSSYEHRAHHHSSAPYFITPGLEEGGKGDYEDEEEEDEEEKVFRQLNRSSTNQKLILPGTELRDFGAHTVDRISPGFIETSGHSSPGHNNVDHPHHNLIPLDINGISDSCRIHGANRFLTANSSLAAPTIHLVISNDAGLSNNLLPPSAESPEAPRNIDDPPERLVIRKIHFCSEFLKALHNVQFIADHARKSEQDVDVREDWKFVAMVLDRLFLWIFTLAVLVGTCGIILSAPTLWDDREPIDQKLSEIALAILNKRRQG